jgi:hypothetical protein
MTASSGSLEFVRSIMKSASRIIVFGLALDPSEMAVLRLLAIGAASVRSVAWLKLRRCGRREGRTRLRVFSNQPERTARPEAAEAQGRGWSYRQHRSRFSSSNLESNSIPSRRRNALP